MLQDNTLLVVNWTLGQYLQSRCVDKSCAMYFCPLLDPLRIGGYHQGCITCVTYVLVIEE